MPQLGPAFLHRPVSGLNLERIEAGAAWLAAGLRASIPEELRAFWWKAETTLYACDGSGEFKSTGLRERSWLGEYRIRADDSNEQVLPATVILPPSLVFETTVDLPNAVRATLEKTVALRMSEVSPIPPENAAFAIGEAKPLGNERFRASVAIARKETLRQVHAAFPEGKIIVIGASQRADGSLAYMFERRGAGSKDAIRNLLLASLALWASLLLLAGAVETRQERALAAIEAFQAELRVEARALRDISETLALRRQYAPSYLRLPEVHARLMEAATALPANGVITQVTATGTQLSVTGLTPLGETGGTALRRSASDYPGLDWFEQQTPLGPVPDRLAP
jgi:hypothetical protein